MASSVSTDDAPERGRLSETDDDEQELLRLLHTLNALLAEERRHQNGDGPAANKGHGGSTAGNNRSADPREPTRGEAILALLERVKTEQWRVLRLPADKIPPDVAALLKGTTLDTELERRRRTVARLRSAAAMAFTIEQARRPRARRHHPTPGGGVRFERDKEPIFDSTKENDQVAPVLVEHHDVFVMAPKGVHAQQEFFRFPVVKGGSEKAGHYLDKPELLDDHDYGQRKVVSVGRPHDWGPPDARATQWGPAFATLPVKPEPAATAFSVCYLLNSQNLNYRNAWTAEEWNDAPGGADLPPAPGATRNEFEALIAGPQGKVFRLELHGVSSWTKGTRARLVFDGDDGASRQQPEMGYIESVDLRPHMEVWHQLRGGTAMGRVLFEDANGRRVLPLVNITTLTRD